MDASTQAALRRINRDFYRHYAADFDRTRHPGGWPGWRRVVESAAATTAGDSADPLRVLDLGCGNGRFALFLERNPELRSGQPFTYRGIDLSPELINHARTAAADSGHIRFEVGDIEKSPLNEAAHDLVVLFGVLHHLPGFSTRRRALGRAASAVAPGGLLATTCWQFADDARFQDRRLDWALEAGIDPAQLEEGDHLLRWGPGDSGARRYCHHTDEPELDRLVGRLPLTGIDRYRADGHGGRQNLYWLGGVRQVRGRG